jgi:DNA repair protein RecO (recombination protein O)
MVHQSFGFQAGRVRFLPGPQWVAMSSEKSTAIILRVTEFSETSCIVSMLTREFGKLTAIAKGARRPKSPFEAAIDVLAICRVVFIHKTHAMSLLTEARLEHRFRAAETDLKRLYIGFYLIELLKSLTDEGDPQPELFDFCEETIRFLDSDRLTDSGLAEFVLRFELGLLELTGHFPMLTRCVSCGREKTVLSKINFGLNAGGILCQSCRRGQSNIVPVSESGFRWLLDLVGAQVGERHLNSDNWNDVDRVNERRIRGRSWLSGSAPLSSVSDGVADSGEPVSTALRNETAKRVTGTRELSEVRQLLGQYLTHLIGNPPRLHQFLKNI